MTMRKDCWAAHRPARKRKRERALRLYTNRSGENGRRGGNSTGRFEWLHNRKYADRKHSAEPLARLADSVSLVHIRERTVDGKEAG